jgi:hypothetical protein
MNETDTKAGTNRTLESPVEAGLRALWRKDTALVKICASAWILAALCGFLVFDFALDWPIDLPPSARLLLLLANVAGLAAIIYSQLWRRLRPYHPVELALRVERVNGGLEGLLVSSVQFQSTVPSRRGMSAELVRAVCRQAAARAASIDFAGVADVRRLRPILARSLPVIVLVLAAVCWQPRFFLVLGRRILNPWSSAAYPTNTRIETSTGDMTVRQTDVIHLAAHAAGVIPETGVLHIRFKGAGWEQIQLERTGAGDFAHALPRANDGFDYYFTIGDAHSQRSRVTIEYPPRITDAQVRLKYAPYTRLDPQNVNTMNLSLPEGTSVQWRLQLDRSVAGAELLMEDRPPVPLKMDADGRTASLELTPEASSSYTFRFHWKLGDHEYADQVAKYYLQIVPDADPQVGLISPIEDGKATLSKIVDLAFWAKDDYALGEARIVYALNDGEEKRSAIGPLDGKKSAERRLSWPIAGEIKNLKEGDIVTFAVEVSDLRSGPGHFTRSRSRRLQFVSAPEYLAYTLARQRRYLGQLRPLYLQEMDAAAQIRALSAPARKERQP